MLNRSFILIQDSFTWVEPIALQVANNFFTQLFILAPELRPHFPAEAQRQIQLFMEMVTFVVTNLERVDLLLLRMQELGHYLAGAGVRPAHYEAVQVALLDALTAAVGCSTFTAETRVAWCELYTLLANAAQHAAERHRWE